MTSGEGEGCTRAGHDCAQDVHYLSWDVLLRHIPLVPCPLQASALFKYLLSGHFTSQPSPGNPEKEKSGPITCLGGRQGALPASNKNETNGRSGSCARPGHQ